MRRLLATATLVALGLSVTAYADDARSFTSEQLRADAHKQQRAVVESEGGIPIDRVADKPCGADGLAGDTSFECSGIDLLSFVPQDQFGGSDPAGVGVLGGGVSDIWGWVDPQPNAEGVHDEYVMLGKTNGVALFRITDPLAPEFLGQVPNASPGQLVWHDIKVFQDHAFIVSESVAHGMNVLDLSRLRALDAVEAGGTRVVEPDTNYPTAFSAHNIAINEETGYAYIVGGNTGLVVPDQCLSGLHMVDVNDPKNPVFAGCHLTGEGRGTAAGAVGVLPESPVSYIHDTQCVVYRGPDADYTGRELCFNSSEDHMSVVDVTDKLLPRQVALVEYPETAYAHQGWLTADQSHFLMGDELDEGATADRTRTVVFDVTDLDAARYVGANQGTTSAIDHNMYEKDGLFYQSNYAAGLQVLDSSGLVSGGDDATLPQVAFFDGFPQHDDPTFNGTWSNYPYFPSGTVAFSGIDEGLFLVKVQQDVLDQFATGTDGAPEVPARATKKAKRTKG